MGGDTALQENLLFVPQDINKVRILFVDDDERTLTSLRDMLRKKRNVWDLSFACGGQAALDLLEVQSFDVIVSDMRMRGVDGAAVLGFAAKKHPKTIRIILSGHTDVDAALRVVQVAHQFMLKPCSPQSLSSIISRAVQTQKIISDDDIRLFCGQMSELPVLPQSYHSLKAVLSQENAGVKDVAQVLSSDISMTAKVLQLSNSSFFRVSRRINNVEEAAVHLGVNTIKNLVLSVGVFSNPAMCKTDEIVECHRRSLITATTSAMLGTSKVLKEDAFTAGMLSEVGLLVFSSQLPEMFRDVKSCAEFQDKSIENVLRQDYRISLQHIGAYLLGTWGIPYSIIEAVAHRGEQAEVPLQNEISVLSCLSTGSRVVTNVLAERDPVLGVDKEYLKSLGHSWDSVLKAAEKALFLISNQEVML